MHVLALSVCVYVYICLASCNRLTYCVGEMCVSFPLPCRILDAYILVPSQSNQALVSGGAIFVARVDTVNNEPVSIRGGFFDENEATFGNGGAIFARGKNGTTTLEIVSLFGSNIAGGSGNNVFEEDYSSAVVDEMML